MSRFPSYIELSVGVMIAMAAIVSAATQAPEMPAPDAPPIILAANKGDIEEVKRLLAAGSKTDTRDAKGYTPLAWAAVGGHLAVADLLVKNKAGVNALNAEGFAPLNWAAYYGHLALVKLLVANNADVNVRGNKQGWRPLLEASSSGQFEVVAYLIDSGADVRAVLADGRSALVLAAEQDESDVVRLLLGRGGDATAALMVLARKGGSGGIRVLLAAGVNVSATANKGRTALLEAANANQVEAMTALLEGNADPNLATSDAVNMTTPLMWAAYHCNADAVRLLVAKGADRRATNGTRTAHDLARTGWTTNMRPCSDDILSTLAP